jgi:hypothetical protein
MRTFCIKLSMLALLIPGLNPAHAEQTFALEQAADSQRAEYRQQQWTRLAKANDRDSLIAAVLIGMPFGSDAPVDGHELVERHLAETFGSDPLALYVLALSCQVASAPCTRTEYYDMLVRIAPDNAVHWLLLPNKGEPSAAQLHSAASASIADSHLGATISIVRSALADQPAPQIVPGVDANELALKLRRTVADLVPVAIYGKAVIMCKPPKVEQPDDCIALGRSLFHDQSGSILTRMIGSAILRRLLKGTPEDTAAREFRREYVWGDQQLTASHASYQEQFQIEIAQFGEWEAWQRSLDRSGIARKPPAGWTPSDPNLLLLSEERTPAATK